MRETEAQRGRVSCMRLHTKEASLVAQMVKHLPTMQETRIRALGREDPLEKEIATHIRYRMDKQEGPTVGHRNYIQYSVAILYNIFIYYKYTIYTDKL